MNQPAKARTVSTDSNGNAAHQIARHVTACLNQQIGPAQDQFSTAAKFGFMAKSGMANSTRPDELAATIKPGGQYAAIDLEQRTK